MREKLKSLIWGIIFAGIIIFLTGCYYAILEAGLPYQDPTPEMQIEYAINMGIGRVLTRCGGLTFLVGLFFRIILSIVNKGITSKKVQKEGAAKEGQTDKEQLERMQAEKEQTEKIQAEKLQAEKEQTERVQTEKLQIEKE